MANQIAIGTGASIYSMPGMAASTAAQVGPTNFTTIDANGTLGSSIYGPATILQMQNQIGQLAWGVSGLQLQVNALSRSIQRGYEGTAISLAVSSVALPDNKKFAISTHVGEFRGQYALGGAAQLRVNANTVLDAGVGVGLRNGGVGARAGATFAW